MRRSSTSLSTLARAKDATATAIVETTTKTQALTTSIRYSIPQGGAQSPMA